ncbi:MAG: hypothetical protein AB7F75_04455 [Planctomycetota bacterium]
MRHSLFLSQAIRGEIANAQAKITADSAKSNALDAKNAADAIRNDLDKLFMITEALWSILRDKHGYTEAELIERITEIDLKDGVINNRGPKAGPVACAHCHRPNSARHAACSYCGEPLGNDPFRR